jgi:hypothetical protein
MEKIRGNMAKDFVLAQPEDRNFYWVQLKRRVFNPAQNKMVNQQVIRSFSQDSWNNKPSDWVAKSGYHTFLLLNDPSI